MLPVGVGTQLLAALVEAGQAWHDEQGEVSLSDIQSGRGIQ